MARVKKTAEEIQTIVSTRLHQLKEVRDDRSMVRVPLPLGHQPDKDGANWDMGVFGGDAVAYIGAIQAIVHQARKEFELVLVPAP